MVKQVIAIKPLVFLALLAIYLQLDATPSLYLADLIVQSQPSILRSKYKDTVTLITGASQGIGAEIALQLCAKTESKLILMARRGDKLEKVCEECIRLAELNNSGAVVVGIEADVTIGTKAMTEKLTEGLRKLGKKEVDVAFINAGKSVEAPLAESSEELVRSMIEVNLMGAISTSEAVMSTYGEGYKNRPVAKQLIAITSMAALVPAPLRSAYGLSKAAAAMYFNTLRAEHPEIRVMTVIPGAVASKLGFGADDYLKPVKLKKGDSRTSVSRAVELILSGSVAKPAILFQEIWFANHLWMGIMYMNQYIPSVAKKISSILGPKLVESWKRKQSQ